MTKKLIFLCGPNGVGKSSTGREFVNHMEYSAFIDSDICALRNPFIDPEGISLGKQFMQYMLSKYLESSQYKYIVWAYGFHGHRKSNFIKIMAALRELKAEFDFMPIILTCDLDENIKRMKCDNRDEARIDGAIRNTRTIYDEYPFPFVDITNLSIKETVDELKEITIKP